MREMRRKDRLISQEEAMEVLKKGEYGILATVDESGQPYGVPVSYVVLDGSVYFHSTNAGGHKFDNFTKNSKVSFTVVGNTQVLPDQFATLYESAIVTGEAVLVDDESERIAAFREFLPKYSPAFLAEGEQYIKTAGPLANIVKIHINEISGKSKR
jgi:uncharacterized protein